MSFLWWRRKRVARTSLRRLAATHAGGDRANDDQRYAQQRNVDLALLHGSVNDPGNQLLSREAATLAYLRSPQLRQEKGKVG